MYICKHHSRISIQKLLGTSLKVSIEFDSHRFLRIRPNILPAMEKSLPDRADFIPTCFATFPNPDSALHNLFEMSIIHGLLSLYICFVWSCAEIPLLIGVTFENEPNSVIADGALLTFLASFFDRIMST